MWTSVSVRMPTMRSRVDCGLALTMLSFSPTMRLSRVDLPALGFTTTVTIPALGIMEASGQKQQNPLTGVRGFCQRCRRRPTLPRSRERSTIGAVGLNDRVRNGNECGPYALVASDESIVRRRKGV